MRPASPFRDILLLTSIALAPGFAEIASAQTQFVSSRPESLTAAPVLKPLPPGIPAGSIVLIDEGAMLPKQIRSRTCLEAYGAEKNGPGQVNDSRYQLGANDWSAWHVYVDTCL